MTRCAPGDEVLLYPALGWGDRDDAPTDDFEIFGIPRQGVFAEQAVAAGGVRVHEARAPVVRRGRVHRHRRADDLAGLVTRGGVGEGSTVLVTGAAAGTGTFAIQIATALGARVYVDQLERGEDRALRRAGRRERRRLARPELVRDDPRGDRRRRRRGARLGRRRRVGRHPARLRPGGTLVNFGDTAGDFAHVAVALVYWGQLSIHGSTLGSPREFAALLEHLALDPLAAGDRLHVPARRTDDAFRRIDDPARFGKIVLDVS